MDSEQQQADQQDSVPQPQEALAQIQTLERERLGLHRPQSQQDLEASRLQRNRHFQQYKDTK